MIFVNRTAPRFDIPESESDCSSCIESCIHHLRVRQIEILHRLDKLFLAQLACLGTDKHMLSRLVGSSNCLQFGRKSAAGTGLFMFHSMFMNGTVRRADLWFLAYSVFTQPPFEHVYRCSPPMQPHHAK